MNWSIRYASSKRPCLFCGGANHWLHSATKEWTEENAGDIGLPRPSVATEPLLSPFGANAQNNWRKRVVIPWSARATWPDKPVELGTTLKSAPAPHPEREQAVREEGRCAMCGDTFTDNEPAIRFTGWHDQVQSDHYPMHPECMRQTVIFCPHMKELGNDFSQLQSGKSKFFSRGAFKDLFRSSVGQTKFRQQ